MCIYSFEFFLLGGGNPGRLKQVWDEYLSSQTEVTAEPVAELPIEVAEEVKAVSSALAERIWRVNSKR